jgi:hypothetical protein
MELRIIQYRSPLGLVLTKLFRVATLLQRLAKVFNTNLYWCQALFRRFDPDAPVYFSDGTALLAKLAILGGLR